MEKAIAILVSVFASLILFSCSDDDKPDSLEGTKWVCTIENVEGGGFSWDFNYTLTFGASEVRWERVNIRKPLNEGEAETFRDDETMKYTYYSSSGSGFYGKTSDEEIGFTVKGNRLETTAVLFGVQFNYTKSN